MKPSLAARLQQIQADTPAGGCAIMNVCGGHERLITMAALRDVLPAGIRLIAGPGCPVCVCPEEDIYTAIQLALSGRAGVLAFGDLLRAPVNTGRRELRSLEQARTAGGDVRAIAAPQDAVALATAQPQRQFVFFAAGFETTMAPVAAMLAGGLPDNLSVLLAGRRTWPVIAMLLGEATPAFQALIAPGHVATVMGVEEWQFVPHDHGLPAAVAGFSVDSLLAAIASVLQQLRSGQPHVANCYREVVSAQGNRRAQHVLQQVMATVDAPWRGIGTVAASGFSLRPAYRRHDARLRFADLVQDAAARERAGAMPAGCDCAAVVLGRIAPNACRLYGTACTPQHPVGPCMVSDEGACRVWWSGGRRVRAGDRQWQSA